MFFVFTKLLFFFFNPFNLTVFLLAGAALARWRGWDVSADRLGGAALAVMLVLGVLPVGALALHGLETAYEAPSPKPARVDGIIVLGGFIDTEIGMAYGTPQLDTGVDRLNAFIDLARAYPRARLYFSGGEGTLARKGEPEARMLGPVLARMRAGDVAARLVIDGKARNTYENVLNLKALANPRDGQSWLLVTSAYHMPRALGVFRAQGWDVRPVPADYILPPRVPLYSETRGFLGNFEYAHLALREGGGMAVYALAGRWRPLLGSASGEAKSVDKHD